MKDANLNGIDTARMSEIVDGIKNQPEIAKFEFRAKNEWVGGGENHSTIRDFYGVGQEDTTRTEPFVFVADEPTTLLGQNKGANPVEFLLHSLAGCVTTTFVLHAAARGIHIQEIKSSLDGDIDLQGLLGLDENVTPGYQGIRFKMDVKADCSDEELDDLLAFTAEHSPVCQSLRRPVPVTVERAA